MLGPIIVAIILACYLYGEVKWGVFTQKKKSLATPDKVKELPEPHVMSWIGRQVMKKYNDLPEPHKPSFDVRAAVVALDVKHQIVRLDNHFLVRHNTEFSFADCDCTLPRAGEKRSKSCEKYPEFGELWHAMREIQWALRRLEEAEAARERKIELAGIDNDLRSVDDILDAFRTEASIIRETAKEISV